MFRGRRSRRPCTIEVERTAAAGPAELWACLADPGSFARWVSGTAQIRRADGDWPAVGAVLHHRWGPWPLRVRDRTTVTACHAPDRLELHARARPIAVVHVVIRLDVIRLDRVSSGSRVVLRESIVSGIALGCRPLTRRIQRWRNRRSLDGLVRLCGERTGA